MTTTITPATADLAADLDIHPRLLQGAADVVAAELQKFLNAKLALEVNRDGDIPQTLEVGLARCRASHESAMAGFQDLFPGVDPLPLSSNTK